MPTRWYSRSGEVFEPTSWLDCVELLLSSGGDEAFYRGQRCYDWPLLSSLERALLRHAERWEPHRYSLLTSMAVDKDTETWASYIETGLMQRFRQQATRFGITNLPPAWDILGWWEVMQHHGAPTRLMDWTRSPFTALWFASEGHKDGDGDMALWVYDRYTANRMLHEPQQRLQAEEDYELLDERQFQNRFVKYALEYRSPALIPVTPRQFPRAVAQQSILTVSPDIGVARWAGACVREKLAARIRIREEWKGEIRIASRSMGLFRSALFRDLDSLGASLSQSFDDREEPPEAY